MVKNTFKFIIMLIIMYIWLPTGPSDIFFIPFIIEKIGFQMYVVISVLMVIWLYRSLEGRTLSAKLHNMVNEIKKVI